MDELPPSKQIEHLRNLIAAKEEYYQNAVTNGIDFNTLKKLRLDIKLLHEYLQILLDRSDN